MPAFVCMTCGTQFPASETPPGGCRICQDERQFVPVSGQAWTTLDALRQRHRNSYRHYEPGLLGIGTVPDFAIGQRALLVSTPKGNVLWDCVGLLDDATVRLITALGGIAAIAISHPHFYTSMIEWSHAFGRTPVYLHASDRDWVMRPDPVIEFWSGDRDSSHGRSDARQRGRAFRGRHRDALGLRRRRSWRAVGQRHGPRHAGPSVAELHAQLPQLHPALTARRASDRRSAGALFIRPGLRDLVGCGDVRGGKAALARSAGRYIAAISG